MSYQMTEREDEVWSRVCGSTPPSEFEGDTAESIDSTLREVIASHGDGASNDDSEETFETLREIVRKTVGA